MAKIMDFYQPWIKLILIGEEEAFPVAFYTADRLMKIYDIPSMKQLQEEITMDVIANRIRIADTNINELKPLIDDYIFVYIKSEEIFIYVPKQQFNQLIEYYSEVKPTNDDDCIQELLMLMLTDEILVINTNMKTFKSFEIKQFSPRKIKKSRH